MILYRLNTADFKRMPWKNGGGETTQLAIWPPEADLDNFDWRVTSARVDSSGPFSAFPDIDRSLALLSGGDLRLTVATGGEQSDELTLHPGEQWNQFAGETSVYGEVAPGSTLIDFNVMTRRGCYRHRLRPLRLDGEQWVDHPLWLIYLTAGSLRAGSLTLSISPGELLWSEGPAWLRGQAEGWLVEIETLAGAESG
ncbi:HutD/Ves family protein [Paludibacterium purpuratum]|uniref:HutD protein n=1 Tax=Paludibacterium purpuratum TaxID=1144873 RepID=A0A4R7B035_9NEIS|nr:HutD family protein [Paludibacterium purpuratum]TDR73599.1 hypothetical protein DFP86_113106 [Paludibacterium purpuratum]